MLFQACSPPRIFPNSTTKERLLEEDDDVTGDRSSLMVLMGALFAKVGVAWLVLYDTCEGANFNLLVCPDEPDLAGGCCGHSWLIFWPSPSARIKNNQVSSWTERNSRRILLLRRIRIV